MLLPRRDAPAPVDVWHQPKARPWAIALMVLTGILFNGPLLFLFLRDPRSFSGELPIWYAAFVAAGIMAALGAGVLYWRHGPRAGKVTYTSRFGRTILVDAEDDRKAAPWFMAGVVCIMAILPFVYTGIYRGWWLAVPVVIGMILLVMGSLIGQGLGGNDGTRGSKPLRLVAIFTTAVLLLAIAFGPMVKEILDEDWDGEEGWNSTGTHRSVELVNASYDGSLTFAVGQTMSDTGHDVDIPSGDRLVIEITASTGTLTGTLTARIEVMANETWMDLYDGSWINGADEEWDLPTNASKLRVTVGSSGYADRTYTVQYRVIDDYLETCKTTDSGKTTCWDEGRYAGN